MPNSKPKNKIRFVVAYEGTGFCGWQKQNHGPLPSVQQTLEEALAKLLQEKIVLFASGRTDAGVHARAQVCHFETTATPERFQRWDFAWSLKSVLPPSIVVKKLWWAPPEFHSTLSATHKTYKYFILNSPRPSPFLRHHAHWFRHPLDMDYLNLLSQQIVGTHDFKSFQSTGTPVHHTVREIFNANWELKRPHQLVFTITGEGFLKQMVRNIVGTQLMLEKQKAPVESFKSILLAKDRQKAGPPAPAEGLFLWKVYYPSELDNKCRPL